MRVRKFMSMESVFLGLGLLILTPSANPTAASKASDPSQTASSQASTHRSADATVQAKPLATWRCTSSWYGEDFDGLPTATGENYDMYAATAAHPTLPLGSIV